MRRRDLIQAYAYMLEMKGKGYVNIEALIKTAKHFNLTKKETDTLWRTKEGELRPITDEELTKYEAQQEKKKNG
jgi:hypothetical protein